MGLVKSGAADLTIVYVLHALRQSEADYGDVVEELNSRVPVLHFRDVQLGVAFSLGTRGAFYGCFFFPSR